MRYRRGVLSNLVFASLLLYFPACTWADRIRNLVHRDEDRRPALKIGEREFSLADLQRFFDSRLSDFLEPSEADRVKSQLLDTFIEEKLLLQQAERHNIQADARSLQAMLGKIAASDPNSQGKAGAAAGDVELEKELRDSLKMQQYLRERLFRSVSVDDEECEAYYRQHLSDYVRDDVVHVREILVEDRTVAEKALALLRKNRNKNFAELARLYSRGPSASEGGDLGSFQRGELPEEFERVIFPLSPGTASKIVQSKYGYHIFLVEEKILAHQQRFYEVKEQIREILILEREREIVKKELQALVNQIPVEIRPERLDFTYVGARLREGGGKLQ